MKRKEAGKTKIEIMLYCYGAVCLSMILFNCVCMVAFRKNDKKLHKKSRRLEKMMAVQIERILQGENILQAHIGYLSRRLLRAGNLMAFDASLEQFLEKEPAAAQQYLREIYSVFLFLTASYQNKENIQAAYFAYFLAKYKICGHGHGDVMTDMIKEYLKKGSFYCRHNAMKVLYSAGSAENVVDSVKILEGENVFFHSKILTEGFLSFEGDHDKLIELFWESFEAFRTQTQMSILNYIRFKSGNSCAEMLKIMTDSQRDIELHFSAIRYFGKYPYRPAYRHLLKFAADTDELHWNDAAISALSLAAYPGEETVETLKKALSSSNWYVRYNAAQSLEKLGLQYRDLTDIINGSDRYAREMMTYWFDMRRLKEEKERNA